jgi:hypothetical protein
VHAFVSCIASALSYLCAIDCNTRLSEIELEHGTQMVSVFMLNSPLGL